MSILKTKFCTIFCFGLMLLCAGFLFSACENSNSVYTKLLDEADALIEQNEDILNNKFEVNMSYSQKLQQAIDSSDKYLKLSHASWEDDENYGPVLFEPVLKAGLAPFSYYYKKVDFSNLKISVASANEILTSFRIFARDLNKFAATKHTLDNRATIDVANSIIQKELDELCANYKNLIESACNLGNKFIKTYEKEVFENKTDSSERYALGEMRLFYLARMSDVACLDFEKDVKYYYDKTFNATYQTNSETLLNYYSLISDYSLWEGTSATISEEEKQCIQTFASIIDYNKVFQSQKQDTEYALNKIDLNDFFKLNSGDYPSTEFDAETRVYTQKINQFFGTYMKNMLNYLQTLTQNIKTFQNS